MKFSAVSALFVSILVVSLSLKIAINHQPKPLDSGDFVREASMMLSQDGFAVDAERRIWSPVIHAEKPGCRLVLANYATDNFTYDRIRQIARPIGPLHYIYRSRILDDPPKVEAFVRDKIISQIRQFGFHVDRAPVLAVAASPTCNIQEIDWSRLASLP